MGHLHTVRGATSHDCYTDAEQQQIREQVARICESPLFSQSKRYPAFLKYIVEQTLKGQPEDLKERTIGVEVFHRSGDYDSNADPTVRIAAGEIRKRLAQYYYEPAHQNELRIELAPVGYVPSFRMPTQTEQRQFAASSRSIRPQGRKSSHRLRKSSLGVGALVLAALAALAYYQSRPEPQPASEAEIDLKFSQFWSQIVDANGPVQMSLGGWVEHEPTGPGLAVTLSSYKSMARITDLLETRKKRYLNTLHVVGPEAGSLSGFLDGPVIYLGYYKPIAKTMANWRYSFEREPNTRTIWVRDSEAVFDKKWRTENVPPQQRADSYAIVARLLDRDLNRPVLVIAGIHSFATVGGVEVVTNPEYIGALLDGAPPNWSEMNFEAVVETRLENDRPGPPKILVTHFWK